MVLFYHKRGAFVFSLRPESEDSGLSAFIRIVKSYLAKHNIYVLNSYSTQLAQKKPLYFAKTLEISKNFLKNNL